MFNRLTQATGSGGTVTHTYNGDGLKTRRVGPDGTRHYYYDGIKPIWETDAAGAMTAQLDRDIFGNLLSRREASGARRYYHFDGLGSTTALPNESGAATSTLLYDAWGNQRAATGSGHGRYRFTGAERDPTTGLYHMGARFYDPAIGRWLSEDPVQDRSFEPATLNFYAYVYGNPLGLIDPDGTIPILAGAGIGALLGLGAYAIATDGNMTLGGAVAAAAAGTLVGMGATAAAARIGAGVAADLALGRAAAAVAKAAIERLSRDSGRTTHIFEKARHGFDRFGITKDRGLGLIRQALEEAVRYAGRSPGLQIGTGVHYTSVGTDTSVRLAVRAHWDGTAFRVISSWLEVYMPGVGWVPAAPWTP